MTIKELYNALGKCLDNTPEVVVVMDTGKNHGLYFDKISFFKPSTKWNKGLIEIKVSKEK